MKRFYFPTKIFPLTLVEEDNQNAVQSVDFRAAVETTALCIQTMSDRDHYAQSGTWGQPRKHEKV